MDDMQTRDFEVRRVNADTRTITGTAVPFGETIDRGGLFGGFRERFEPGAFADTRDGVMLFYGHTDPIGAVTEVTEDDQGAHIIARISQTPKGDEVYTLLRDGVLRKLSVGFYPVESRTEDEDTDDPVTVRTKVDLREVSVVPIPAYDGAAVAEVRNKHRHEHQNGDTNMEHADMVTRDDLAAITDQVTDLSRRIDTLPDTLAAGEPGPTYRSGGDLLKALAAGEDAARVELRDVATTGDTGGRKAGWVERPLRFVQHRRKIINLFSTGELPPYGNSVEFPYVSDTQGTAGKQGGEAKALPYMEVHVKNGTAAVATYGGYSALSRQAIERSDVAYLDAVLRFQAIQYAAATETAARDTLTATAGNAVTLAADTVAAWIDAVIDAAAGIEDNAAGLAAEFAVCSRDVFKALAHKTDSADRPVFVLNGDGQNTIGSANLVSPEFRIATLPGVVDAKLPAGTFKVGAAEAITTRESAGAPFRLQDEDIVKLTRDFSLYGYLAHTVNDALGISTVDTSVLTGGGGGTGA